MRIQIVVFMVLAIQVCPIICVDLDAILSAVEEDQQASSTMPPPPGTYKAAPLIVPLSLELPKLSLEKASAADCPGTSQPPLLYSWGLATTANQDLQILVNIY